MGRRANKKAVLLRAGSQVMYRKGYNATGVQEIVDAAQIPKGSFYNYFASKEAFALEAMDGLFAWSLQSYRQFLSEAGIPPLLRIQRLFKDLSAKLVEEQHCSLGCFLGNLVQEMGDANEAVRTKAEHCFEQYRALLAGTLREAQAQGSLAATRDPEILADFIYNSWQGSMLRMKAAKSAVPLQVFQEVLAEVLLR